MSTESTQAGVRFRETPTTATRVQNYREFKNTAQFQQATTVQTLMKALAERNLTLDKDGKLVQLRPEAKK